MTGLHRVPAMRMQKTIFLDVDGRDRTIKYGCYSDHRIDATFEARNGFLLDLAPALVHPVD